MNVIPRRLRGRPVYNVQDAHLPVSGKLPSRKRTDKHYRVFSFLLETHKSLVPVASHEYTSTDAHISVWYPLVVATPQTECMNAYTITCSPDFLEATSTVHSSRVCTSLVPRPIFLWYNGYRKMGLGNIVRGVFSLRSDSTNSNDLVKLNVYVWVFAT